MVLPPASAERHLLQGLIQLANGGLKARMGRENAARRIAALADTALREAFLQGQEGLMGLGRAEVGQAGHRLFGPGRVPPGVGHRVQEACRIEPDEMTGRRRRAARVLQHELVVFRQHGQHAGAALGGRAPPRGRAVQAVVQQRLGGCGARPLTLDTETLP